MSPRGRSAGRCGSSDKNASRVVARLGGDRAHGNGERGAMANQSAALAMSAGYIIPTG